MLSKWPAAMAGVLVAAAIMLWPAFYNGQAFFFPDTTAYVRGADAAAQRLTGISTSWSRPTPGLSVSSVADKTVLAGRSIYYGALLYVGDRGSGWPAIALQAALLVLALLATLKAFDLDRWPYFVLLVAVVAAFTAAPLYASFLMPDVFTGLTILACAMLLTCDMRSHKLLAAFWFVLLAMALTFHTTHMILAFLMFGVGAVLFVWRRRYMMPRGLGAIGLAMLFAYLCGTAFTFGVTKLVGEPPLTPPFLMARVLDDGPGYRYLLATCPGNGFVVCDYMKRLPLQSDDFLWTQSNEQGVFAPATPLVRRALSREQYRFALAVIGYDPWGQFEASTRNALEQSVQLGATEFSYTDGDKATFAGKVPQPYFDVMKNTPAYTGKMPIRELSALSYASTFIGLACLVWILGFGRYGGREDSRRVVQLVALVVFGVVANAAICGVMSGPHDRYEARVAWLIPALALIAHFQIYRDWWAGKLAPLMRSVQSR